MGGVGVPARAASPWGSAVALVAAAVLHLVAQSFVLASGFPRSFRAFVLTDQLGYLAMVTEVASGDPARQEPYTGSGLNTYPNGYYGLVGGVAHALDLGPTTAWNLVGLGIQATMVVVLGWLVVRLTGRSWAAFAVPLTFLTGVLAWILAPGQWRVPFQFHSAVWGPYGVFAPLNAETGGLALGVIAFALLGHAWLLPASRRVRLGTGLVAAVLIGATASAQTYSFLSLVYVAVAVAAAWGVLSHRPRLLVPLTLALVALVYAVGPILPVGQLPLLAIGLLPAIPGLVVGLIRSRGQLALVGALLAVGAAPQIVTTLRDVASGDPFLAYRVAQAHPLGVGWQAVVAALPLAIPLVGVLVLALRTERRALAAVAAGILAVWPYVATNDVWGAHAEPYRFWIDVAVVAAAVVPVGVAALAEHASERAFRILVVMWLALLALTLPDYVRWAGDPDVQSLWPSTSSRMVAVREAARPAVDSGKLMLTDPCTDPQTTKVVAGVGLAYYREGMAWPANKEAIDRAMSSRVKGLNVQMLLGADVGWVLTDSACRVDWMSQVVDDLDRVAGVAYVAEPGVLQGSAEPAGDADPDQEMILWRVRGW